MNSNWPDPESTIKRTFVGRHHELNILRNEILRPEHKAVCISGLPGIGKTSLAMFFAETNHSSFPGGIYHFHAIPFEAIDEIVDRQIGKYAERYLIIVDDYEQRPEPQGQYELQALRKKHPNARIIVTSRNVQHYAAVDFNLTLSGLNQQEFYELIRSVISAAYEPEDAQRLFETAKGHPLVLTLAAGILTSEKLTPREFLERLESFSYPGVFSPGGEELPEDSEERKQIVTHIVSVSDEFLKKVHDDPKLLYELSPRSFEDLVAELLNRLGYHITLTPASKDGGKDIYAARQDHLGTFLYIVECKRYAPDRPVGVALVRQLNGVVQAEQATAGILATTSFFTRGANEFQKQIAFQISLKDYYGIQKWLDAVVSKTK